jgi:hypothetical protein
VADRSPAKLAHNPRGRQESTVFPGPAALVAAAHEKSGASGPAGASCHGRAGQGQGDRAPGGRSEAPLGISLVDIGEVGVRLSGRMRSTATGMPNPAPRLDGVRGSRPAPGRSIWRRCAAFCSAPIGLGGPCPRVPSGLQETLS